MKTLISIVIALGLVLESTPKQAETSSVTVRVDGLRNTNGYINISLYDGSGEFPGADAIALKEVEVDGYSMDIVFEDLEPGSYAIAVVHDENGNGDIDMNSYGMPMEGFGFSNEAQATMGPPSFDEAAFEVDGATDHYIELMYMQSYYSIALRSKTQRSCSNNSVSSYY